MNTGLLSPYFAWLLIFLVIPNIILWSAAHRLLWKYRQVFVYTVAIALAVGISFDYYSMATKTWGWPKECCTLPRVAGLPLEEILFGIFAAIFITSGTLIARDIYTTHRRVIKR
jgi:lycopene cyclase domain-containing protein